MDFLDDIDPTDQYMKEMKRVPLLTDQETHDIADKVRAGRAAEKILETASEDMSYEDRIVQDRLVEEKKQAEDWLARANQRLVVSVAKKYQHRGLPLLDLIQEGNIGLSKAINRMDWNRGTRFSTYATWWIRQSIARAVVNTGRTIRIPVHMNEKLVNYHRFCDTFIASQGREPTEQEVMDALDISEQRLRRLQEIAHMQPSSIDQTVSDESDADEVGDMLSSPNDIPLTDSVQSDDVISYFTSLLDTFPVREALVLKLRLGLWDGEEKTLEEAGRLLGVTRERIRQIEAKGIHRLQGYRKNFYTDPPQHVGFSSEKDKKPFEHAHRTTPATVTSQPSRLRMDQPSVEKIIEDANAYLSPEEATRLALFFGAAGKNPMTYEAIGKTEGVSRQRTKQRIDWAMWQLYGVSSFANYLEKMRINGSVPVVFSKEELLDR